MRFFSLTILILFLGSLCLPVACAPTGIYHTVKPGQTLYRIAKTYDVDEDRLARVNNIKDPTQLKVGRRLYIPGVTGVRNVPSSVPEKQEPPSRASSDTPRKQAGSAPVAKRPAAKTPSPAAVHPVRGSFVWPVRGKILSGFGAQGQQVSKGIEIAVAKGTAVVAAASGKVIYSGSAIPGYGNLVILEHSDNFFSVYGFNQKNLVKMDDHVGQGERIALSGAPPNGESARLHFEIRQGKSAIDPILYLP